MTRIERLVIHHSASPRGTSFNSIRQWHLRKGWNDIGYNYVILGNGKLRVGRALPTTGAHAKGKNATSIGVCVVGNNTKDGQHWAVEQRATLRKVVAACRLLWPDIKVCGHRDVMAPGYTECPGVDVEAAFGG